MRMKKLLSFITVLSLCFCMFSACLTSFAQVGISTDAVIESLSEINQQLSEQGKTIDEIAHARVIVKANKTPKLYGSASYMRGFENYHFFQYASADEATQALAYYRSVKGVEFAEVDQPITAQVYEHQYGDYMLGAPEAMERIEANIPDAADVNLAVVDTGINFQLFTNVFTYKKYSKTARCINSKVNTSTSGSADSASDDQGHGTFCTEIILRNTTENVKITGYKALNSLGAGTTADIAACIRKAADDGADIINLSLGGARTDMQLEAIDYAYNKGSIVVCAAGNDATDTALYAPACSDKAITIGALDKSGHKAHYSNFGEELDFVAPGTDIYFHATTSGGGLVGGMPTGYHSGTSFASPYVAAEIALLLSAHPGLSKEQVTEQLKQACVPFESLNYHSGYILSDTDQGREYEEALGLSTVPYSGLLVNAEDYSKFYGYGMPQIDVLINNILDNKQTLAAVVPSVTPGTYYDTDVSVALSAPEGADIYYSLDETYPTAAEGTLYTEPIAVEDYLSVRAVAYMDGKCRSQPIGASYKRVTHAAQEDFTLSEDGSEVLSYDGSEKNIIVPAQIGGYTPASFHLNTPNTMLTGLKLPDSITTLHIEQMDGVGYSEQVKDIEAHGLSSLTYGSVAPFNTVVNVCLPEVDEFYTVSKYVKELDLPQAKTVTCSACDNLLSVNVPKLETINAITFRECISLQQVYAPSVTRLDSNAFKNCYKLSELYIPQVTNDSDNIPRNLFYNNYYLTQLYLPHIRYIGSDCFKGCNVSYLYAPELISAQSLPNVEFAAEPDYTMYPFLNKGKVIVSSAFSQCDVESDRTVNSLQYHNYLTFYATPGSFAQTYAQEQNFGFVALPYLKEEPEQMGHGTGGIIKAEVLGFNLSYQWYGTNMRDNRFGVLLEGQTAPELNTAAYDYAYYYCVVQTHDGEYVGEIVTGESNGAYYDINHDSVISIGDVACLLQYVGENVSDENAFCDINGDGVIDIADVSILLNSQIYGITI